MTRDPDDPYRGFTQADCDRDVQPVCMVCGKPIVEGEFLHVYQDCRVAHEACWKAEE